MLAKRPKGSPEKLGRLLSKNILTAALGARLKDLAIWQLWEQAVGTVIASRAQPLRMIGGVLTVTVSSGPWMQQLSFIKEDIRSRINNLLGEERVKDILLKNGNVNLLQKQSEEYKKPCRALSEEELQWIKKQTASIEDNELRITLQSLMKCHYSHCDR